MRASQVSPTSPSAPVPTGASRERSPPDMRPSIPSTSSTRTPSAPAISARPLSFSAAPSPAASICARRRRKLKNSDFCALVVPVRTMDQFRRT